jgi:LacI family transcriptional regulator
MASVNRGASGQPTIYDVAVRAGVSISTVSLALNSPRRVKADTLDRIMQAVDELGFTPKAEAAIRARRGTGRIGVIAPFTSFPTESGRRLNGILRGAGARAHEIVVFDQESAASSSLMSLPVTRRVDGLIIVSVPFDDTVEQRLGDRAIPTVVLEIPHAGMTSVIIDHYRGGEMVGQFLTGRGHRRLGYLGHRQEHDYPSQSRTKLDGFASALDTAPTVLNVEHTFHHAVEAGRAFLEAPDPPTAVFAHDDLLAAGVLRAAAELGLRVPDDVAVVGFNDTDIAEPLGLTTVRQPFEESGELAVQLLFDQIGMPGTSRRSVTLGVTLVERDTT